MKKQIAATAVALVALTGCQYSVLFNGTGAERADRIEIPVDPQTPVDVGATDFTIEWWMLSSTESNDVGSVTCGAGEYGWTTGHTIIDRDRWPVSGPDGRDFGVSITSTGDVAFGVENADNEKHTLCTDIGGEGITDGSWHHIAVQRAVTGEMSIWIDGSLAASATGPAGDISYPDGVAGARETDPFLVIGAEKHDAGPGFPSYQGLIEEIRISNVIRYTSTFPMWETPFPTDSSTMAIYHLDESGEVTGGSTYVVADSSGHPDGPTNGTLRVSGDGASPVRGIAESPFIETGGEV